VPSGSGGIAGTLSRWAARTPWIPARDTPRAGMGSFYIPGESPGGS
jgi:hypothetical protein